MSTIDLRTSQADVVVVGAGFGGLYAALKMRELGLQVRGFELGADVGGTWFWNRYPGARCDIESLEYSFQFDPDLQEAWSWSERYAAQPEILDYANHITDRYDLRSLFEFETQVTSASFDCDLNRWEVTTQSGAIWHATWLILATGGISVTRTPEFPGKDLFRGTATHTGEWPPEGIDVTNKRVAIIGTGSSAVQAVPALAEQAERLFVLQRSPNYVSPAQNHERDPEHERRVKENYAWFRQTNDTFSNGFGTLWDRCMDEAGSETPAQQQQRFERSWKIGGFSFLFTYADLTSNDDASEVAARFIRGKIAELVDDPATAKLLSPEHPFGCRRLCVGSGYYETFNRPNVSLIDLSNAPITEITEHGVRMGGREIEVDVLIYATGFADQPASLHQMNIRGPDGRLEDAWSDRPHTYLGLTVSGFPNVFLINMPGNPSIATNMITNTEHTVNWISRCVASAISEGADRIDTEVDAQTSWTDYVDTIAVGKVYRHCANLYTAYTDDGKYFALPHLGVPPYLEHIARVEAKDYPGLVFSNAAARAANNQSTAARPTEEYV